MADRQLAKELLYDIKQHETLMAQQQRASLATSAMPVRRQATPAQDTSRQIDDARQGAFPHPGKEARAHSSWLQPTSSSCPTYDEGDLCIALEHFRELVWCFVFSQSLNVVLNAATSEKEPAMRRLVQHEKYYYNKLPCS